MKLGVVLLSLVALLGCGSGDARLVVHDLRRVGGQEALDLIRDDLQRNDLCAVYIVRETSPYTFTEILGVYVSRGSDRAWAARWSRGDQSSTPFIVSVAKDELMAIEKAVSEFREVDRADELYSFGAAEYWLLHVTADTAVVRNLGQRPHYRGNAELVETFRKVARPPLTKVP